MNKKADITLKNFIESFIAITGLVILFVGAGFLGYNLYTMGERQVEENAKNLADLLKEKIEATELGQETKFVTQRIEGDWHIVLWNKDKEPRPDKCFFDNCVCVCQGSFDYKYDFKEEIEENRVNCQGNKGFCRKIELSPLYNGRHSDVGTEGYPSEGGKEFTDVIEIRANNRVDGLVIYVETFTKENE